ncbi:hypothetical protein B7Y94_05535 [Candidatus Saccharibacteria bacterium 32-49-12]|nr:MAG: hypothetical protein B7Y94_05535 [Candidatus Saccharibacteria bacterium 32-49-12]
MANAPTILPPDSDERDSSYNPADQLYREKMATGQPDLTPERADEEINNMRNQSDESIADEIDSLRDKEASPVPSRDGFYRQTTPKQSKVKVAGKALLKRKGPLTAILATLGFTGIGLGALFSPSLMLVHVKEQIVEVMNMQSASLESRTDVLLRSKMKGLTTGCNSVVSLRG